MTSLTLKLVGNNPTDSKYDYILPIPSNEYCLGDIYKHLMEKGISRDMLEDIKFITKGHAISDTTEILVADDMTIIYLFTNKIYVRFELTRKVFLSVDTQPITILHNSPVKIQLPDTPDVIDTLTSDKICSLNKSIIQLFQDPDFRELLRICVTKPHMLNQMASYLTHGDMISDEVEIETDIDNLNKYTNEYNELVNLLKMLDSYNDIHTEEILLKSILYHFNGHLNLSLRFIVYKINLTT